MGNFWPGPGSDRFSLCRLYSLNSALVVGSNLDNVEEWVWLGSNEILFPQTGSVVGLMQEL